MKKIKHGEENYLFTKCPPCLNEEKSQSQITNSLIWHTTACPSNNVHSNYIPLKIEHIFPQKLFFWPSKKENAIRSNFQTRDQFQEPMTTSRSVHQIQNSLTGKNEARKFNHF